MPGWTTSSRRRPRAESCENTERVSFQPNRSERKRLAKNNEGGEERRRHRWRAPRNKRASEEKMKANGTHLQLYPLSRPSPMPPMSPPPPSGPSCIGPCEGPPPPLCFLPLFGQCSRLWRWTSSLRTKRAGQSPHANSRNAPWRRVALCRGMSYGHDSRLLHPSVPSQT